VHVRGQRELTDAAEAGDVEGTAHGQWREGRHGRSGFQIVNKKEMEK
jgi:hypothetical protein